MENQQQTLKKEVRKTTGIIILITSLLGGILLAVSVALQENFFKAFTKELAVILLTVGGVSMIYELFVAEKHFQQFFDLLRRQIERGESNAAICEQLGIREIFPRRDLYEAKYSLKRKAAATTPGANFRIVARTLYLLMNKPETLKQILERGGNIELCFYDPDADPTILKELAELETFDTLSALSTFRRHFITWLQENKPPGNLEIRYHQIHLLESYFSYTLDSQSLAVWDLSFGRDITAKRIFLLDTEKGLGLDLNKRYSKIWNLSISKFKYENKYISLDELPNKI